MRNKDKTHCKHGHVLDGLRRNGRRFCKQCNRIAKKREYDANPEKHRLRSKSFKKNNPEKTKSWAKRYSEQNPDKIKDYYLVKLYGLTLAQYKELLTEQNGVCAICQEEPTKKQLAVDHCHVTGTVRGLLCGPCNQAIGLLKHSIKRLEKAIDHINKVKG